jgi:hypothetical protein
MWVMLATDGSPLDQCRAGCRKGPAGLQGRPERQRTPRSASNPDGLALYPAAGHDGPGLRRGRRRSGRHQLARRRPRRARGSETNPRLAAGTDVG